VRQSAAVISPKSVSMLEVALSIARREPVGTVSSMHSTSSVPVTATSDDADEFEGLLALSRADRISLLREPQDTGTRPVAVVRVRVLVKSVRSDGLDQ